MGPRIHKQRPQKIPETLKFVKRTRCNSSKLINLNELEISCTYLYDIAVRMMPKTIKMEAIMMRIVLQLAEMKTPPMVIPVPDPSSLDSTLSRLIIPEPRLEPGRLLEDWC